MVDVREVDFRKVREDWLGLEQSGHFAEIYQSFEWHEIWWRHYGDELKKLLLLAAYKGDSLIGIAPFFTDSLIIKKRVPIFDVIRFIGSREFDYSLFPVVPEYAKEAIGGFFQYIRQKYPKYVVYLNDVPEQTLDWINDCSSYFPYKGVKKDYICYVINFPATWDEYWRGLGESTRKYLKRYGNRLSPDGKLSLEKLHVYAENDADEFFSMHYKKWKMNPEDTSLSRLEGYEKEIMQLLCKKNQLRLYFLKHGGIRIAAIFLYDYKGKRYFHKTAYDPQYGESRAGSLILFESIKDAFESGLKSFDFLRGEETYKRHFTRELVQCYKIIMANSMLRGKSFEQLISL